jgi:hypothetical protein
MSVYRVALGCALPATESLVSREDGEAFGRGRASVSMVMRSSARRVSAEGGRERRPGEDLGDLAIRDPGEQVTRRGGSRVRAFELVSAAPGHAPGITAPE